jgi:murein L,D-transpeptidase YcbB/YkuD
MLIVIHLENTGRAIMEVTKTINLVSGVMIGTVLLLSYSGNSSRISRLSNENPPRFTDSLNAALPSPGGEMLINPDIITRLYEKAGDHLSPKWNNRDKIEQMLTAIYNAPADGLIADDYHLSDIERLNEKIVLSDEPAIEDIERMEQLLSDAFFHLSSHLAAGRTDPKTIDPQWKASGRSLRENWSSYIDSTLNTNNITDILQNLTPGNREYANLKKALAEYRQLEAMGGWGNFRTSLPKLEKGMRHPDVSLLRKRLAVTQGIIEFNPEDENLFDQALYDQLIIFQQRNGLEADGVVGKATAEALNIPVRDRIETIEANLERWRWISDDLGDRYIMVNAADFELRAIVKNEQEFQTRAIVGSSKRQTPVFSSIMKYMVVNPEWVVPPKILKLDVIPDIIKDSTYLVKKNMKILRMDGSEVEPSSIDWKSVSENRFPYMIRQEPGQGNPLGKIKFMFANEYDVYIHDTPSRSLFTRNIRSFSSGCVRIDNAQELANYLLKDDPDWTPERLQEAIDKGQKRIIVLKKPVPVHILYLTAWADDKGTAYFGKDIYDRDRQLITALK